MMANIPAAVQKYKVARSITTGSLRSILQIAPSMSFLLDLSLSSTDVQDLPCFFYKLPTGCLQSTRMKEIVCFAGISSIQR